MPAIRAKVLILAAAWRLHAREDPSGSCWIVFEAVNDEEALGSVLVKAGVPLSEALFGV